jgi:hypothetical protein
MNVISDLHFIAPASQSCSPPLALSPRTTCCISSLSTTLAPLWDHLRSARSKNVRCVALRHLIGICPENRYLPLFQARVLGHSAQVSVRIRLTLRTQHGRVCTCLVTRHTKRRPLMTMLLQVLSRVVSVDWFNTRLVADLTSSAKVIDLSPF